LAAQANPFLKRLGTPGTLQPVFLTRLLSFAFLVLASRKTTGSWSQQTPGTRTTTPRLSGQKE